MSQNAEQEPVDWEDRIVDRALRELHGERPPDLAAAVTARLGGAGAREARPAALAAAGPRRWLAATVLATGALAAAAVVAIVATLLRDEATRLAGAQIEIDVRAGSLAIASTEGVPPTVVQPGTARVVLLRRGDRLRSTAAAPTEVFFGPFGMVRTEPATDLEVMDMDVRWKNGWVAAGSLTLAVVAGGASWHWITQRGEAEAGEVLRLQTPTEGGAAGELVAARAVGQRLQQENDELRRRLEDLETAGARRSAPVDAAPEPAAEPATAAAAVATAPTFDDPRYAEALAAIDWEVMGKIAAEMGVPLIELAQKLEAGEELPMELAVKIAELNMQLVKQLPTILKAGIEGSGPNGSYSHPVIVANQVASLLQNANLPLSDSQRGALESLVRHFAAENDGIHGGPAELDIDRLVAEVAMKDRMYAEFEQQLDPEQRARLYPEGAGAFDGTSLFRSGIVWQGMVAQVNTPDPAAYVQTAGRRVTEELRLEGEAAAQVQGILQQIAAAAPAEVWRKASPAESRLLRSGRAMRAAQLQQAWMRRVLREVSLTPKQREQLRGMHRVLVPVPH